MDNKKLKVYLDNCCYNRPYDNQEFLVIRHEAEAKILIQNHIKNKDIDLVSSALTNKGLVFVNKYICDNNTKYL